ncbi:MAG: DUF116 domain-containing protein [Syntrophomonadaceae bacterium]|nr:DUF116 domain-containing protein [Syntrophomonadaceae bacterium]
METRKRIYVGLLSASLLVMLALVSLIWFVVSNRDLLLNQIVLIILAVLAIIMIAFMGIGIIAMVIMIIRSRTIPSLETISRVVNEWLFPITLLLGRALGIQKEKILRSFISVNNYLVSSKSETAAKGKIMILAPHCLQNSECQHKITVDVENCKECGKCKIGDLKKIAHEHGAVLRVATGGTLARKYIKDTRPAAVIAIACERDLSMGIHETNLIPVMGVLNCRPNGPCYNTDVEIEKVNDALQVMSKGG